MAVILRAFWRDARGATAIEYCLIAATISIAVVVGARSIGANLSSHYFTPIANNLS